MSTYNQRPSANFAVLVGSVENEPRRMERRSALQAQVHDVVLQLLTPFGVPFSVRLTIPGVVQGGYKLRQVGQRIAVEGQVRLERGFDRRFAHEGQLRGQPTREMQFIVKQVRDARDDEPLGASFVALEGEVLDPPRFARHPQMPDLQLALIRFGVREERPAPYPGSALVRVEQMQVNLSILTTHEHAVYMYQPGNQVRVRGELDCVLLSRRQSDRSEAEVATVQRIRNEWDATQRRFREQPELLRANPRAEEQAYSRYLGQLRRFEDTARWRVLVGAVEPVAAQPIEQHQARRLRRTMNGERDAERNVKQDVASAPQAEDTGGEESQEPSTQPEIQTALTKGDEEEDPDEEPLRSG